MSRLAVPTLVVAFATALALAAAAPSLATAKPAAATGAHLISHSREAVPFVADDYARALAAAHAKRVPIFVETWAPW
jgi:hypothetical protein